MRTHCGSTPVGHGNCRDNVVPTSMSNSASRIYDTFLRRPIAQDRDEYCVSLQEYQEVCAGDGKGERAGAAAAASRDLSRLAARPPPRRNIALAHARSLYSVTLDIGGLNRHSHESSAPCPLTTTIALRSRHGLATPRGASWRHIPSRGRSVRHRLEIPPVAGLHLLAPYRTQHTALVD